MRLKLTPLLVAFLLVLFVPASSYAGYDEGVQALKSKNYALALEQFSEAADAGNLEASVALAEIYGRGLGVKRDIKKAFDLLSNAARQGNSSAQRDFGLFHLPPGNELELDSSEGIPWLLKAGEAGDAVALGYLGNIYSGMLMVPGVEVNKVKAHIFFHQAGQRGWKHAGASIWMLENKMTKSQIKEAKSQE